MVKATELNEEKKGLIVIILVYKMLNVKKKYANLFNPFALIF